MDRCIQKNKFPDTLPFTVWPGVLIYWTLQLIFSVAWKSSVPPFNNFFLDLTPKFGAVSVGRYLAFTRPMTKISKPVAWCASNKVIHL